MENFKRKLRNRIIITVIYCVIVLALTIVAAITDFNDSATAFNLGFGTGIGAVAVFFMIKYCGALKNEEKLKKLYIEEHDERQKHVDALVGRTGINIIILLFVLAMLVSHYFSRTIFYTLLAATLFTVAVKAILGVYYNKKV